MRVTLVIAATALLLVPSAYGQDSPAQDAPQGPRTGEQRGQRPLLGKITAIREASMELADIDGNTITVKLSAKTEFRKDRNPAKLSDFKVGDYALVRGSQAPDGTVTADVVATRSGQAAGAGMRGGPLGTLGKDLVVGEVKSIDAPKLTVARPDGIVQILELNEETSLRRGRESITMADIQIGDHIVARGVLDNGVFVPKGVMVVGTEQWQRMQQMGVFSQDGPRTPKPKAPENSQPRPLEPLH